MRRKTTKFPGFPQGATLGPHQRVVNSQAALFSPVWSMTCTTLHRLVQALSTSVCFVSNFENRTIFETYTRSSRALYETLTAAPIDQLSCPMRSEAGQRLDAAGHAAAAAAEARAVQEDAKKKWRSRPVSRVLSWTVIPLGASSPIRSSNLPGPDAGRVMRSLFGLAPGGVCRAGLLPGSRCALTAPFHPCRPARGSLGRYLSVALSVGSRRPGVTWHRALWSPDFPRHRWC